MNNEIPHLLEQILAELRQMRKENLTENRQQTELVRLWMGQDENYHQRQEKILKREGVE